MSHPVLRYTVTASQKGHFLIITDPDLVRRVVEELEHFEAVCAELPAEKDVDKVGVGDNVDLDMVDR